MKFLFGSLCAVILHFGGKNVSHVIKFENCFTLSIRIKDFYSFKDKLTLLKCLEINEIFNFKKQYHFKAPFGEHFISHLTDKNVRFDINEN